MRARAARRHADHPPSPLTATLIGGDALGGTAGAELAGEKPDVRELHERLWHSIVRSRRLEQRTRAVNPRRILLPGSKQRAGGRYGILGPALRRRRQCSD